MRGGETNRRAGGARTNRSGFALAGPPAAGARRRGAFTLAELPAASVRKRGAFTLAELPAASVRKRGAFTLAELLVVVGMISLTLGIVLPSMLWLFSAGAENQAEAVFSAVLGSARGLAIETQRPAAAHVQIGKDSTCWVIILTQETAPGLPTTGKFVLAPGYPPRQMPGDKAFGEISPTFVDGDKFTAAVNADTGPTGLEGFTSFTVAFAPDGSLVRRVAGLPISIYNDSKLFSSVATSQTALFDACPADEDGVRAMTVFSFKELKLQTDRAGWLNKNGRFMCINPYTGQFMSSEGKR